MFTEQVLHNITYPLVQTGIYENEDVALINIAYELIEKKLYDYRAAIQALERKHQQDFEQFTQALAQKATYEDEEDWMEWKGAVEMTFAWNSAKQQLLNDEIARQN
ncbi:MAG: hypothetical protein GY801_00160 [bacterium]|nr:hypothetical protein [bacterium]